MANPLRDFFFGAVAGQTVPKKDLTDAITPRRSFADVILPAATRQQLDFALVQIQKSDLIFSQWGLGERHATGMGLAFNFAGPPGTGKTICAEAIAYELNKNLLIVRYAEMESLWAGETGKNVASIFRMARDTDSVLFFDEADAVATRRFGNVTQGYQRESNAVVNVLLKELEEFDGVVIFATNLASNFDPAFERRIRTHILFEMPDAPAREKIWQVQLHSRKTPLADDVDFKELGEKYAVAGGDIKNAVLKAAQMASAEMGPDPEKKIYQRHFIAGIEEVMKSKNVMAQSLMEGDGSMHPQYDPQMIASMGQAFDQLAQNDSNINEDLQETIQKLAALESQFLALPEFLNTAFTQHTHARENLAAELGEKWVKLEARLAEIQLETARQTEREIALGLQLRTTIALTILGILSGFGGIITALVVR